MKNTYNPGALNLYITSAAAWLILVDADPNLRGSPISTTIIVIIHWDEEFNPIPIMIRVCANRFIGRCVCLASPTSFSFVKLASKTKSKEKGSAKEATQAQASAI